ncbi:MAG: MotA/TolQ/ExbB proton channel family protein, partial [Alistipes sp.]|nr:MotA/TolQ/ExbB proton channel family protein [Alistipes sp.]
MNILTTNPMVEATEEIAQASVETLAEGVTEAADTLSISFWDLFMSGGWLMWVLVLLAAVMIFIFIERFIAIRRATKLDKNFMNRIRDFISEGNINAAIDLCRRTDSPVARMIEKGIERIGRP